MINTYKTKLEGLDGVELLDVILAEGYMSAYLRYAIEELKTAILSGNDALASKISYGIEQHIIGNIDDANTEYAFQEDDAANNYFLGDDIYSLMGSFDWHGVSKPKVKGWTGPISEHPVIKRIAHEHQQCIVRAAIFHAEIGLDKLPAGWKVVKNEPKSDYAKDNPVGRLVEITDGKTLLTLDCVKDGDNKRFAISKRTMAGKKLADVNMTKHDCGAMLTKEDIWPASEALVDAAKAA
jgi:hypothetical protein